MVPEILAFMFTKFRGKSMVDIPHNLDIPARHGRRYNYKLVAQSEHSGSQTGGHYWARVLRNNAGIHGYMLNDLQITHAPLTSTSETYMVFYHIL